jgi:hypothetical protein
MNAKIPLKKFAETFGNTQSVPYSESETFIKSVFETISEELKAGESVKINGLGTFRLSSTSDDPVIFTPDASFAAEINAPFAMFSPVELAEDLPDNAFEEVETETATVAQESVEEAPVAATEQESVDVRSDSTIDTEQNIEENQPEETAEIITDTDNKSVIDTDIRQDSEEIPASECTCTVPLGQTLPQENIAGTELPVNTEQPAADRDEKNIPAPAASAIKDWEYEEEEYVTPPDAEQPKGKFGNGFLAGLIVGLAIGALALCLYILYYVNIPADSDSADTDIEQVENAGTTAYM